MVALGLLGGAVAKSAQIPLHTWLPDAMEGPTPVSALIHAATMVTAGVYLIVRCHVLFEKAYVIQDLAAGLGAATLLMAGLIALVQTDIKRVIAYSTMSQIGYMFVGAGLGAYSSGMFHLLTHAFFKALLFLAAGLAIHALAGEQDIRKLAGIGKLMPQTKWLFLAGSLALVGVPPFAGFFSKDSIIAAALDRGWYGDLIFAAGPDRRAAHRPLRLPPLLHRVHRRADRVGARALPRPPRQGGPALDALDGGRARAARGGRRLDPVHAEVAPAVRLARAGRPADRRGDERAGGVRLDPGRRARPGRDRHRLAAVLGEAAPGPGARSRCSSTSSTGTSCTTAIWYRGSDLVARGLYAIVERPLIAGSIREVAQGFGHQSEELGRVQNGLVRSYVLALASGIVVLAFVFMVAR